MLPLLLIIVSTLFHVTLVKSLTRSGTSAVKLWHHQQRNLANGKTAAVSDPPSGIVLATFTQPLDHFDPTNTHTFEQQYWVNAEFYKDGGPVFVIDSGEGPGAARIPFIQNGVAAKVCNATGGLALILQHRYYGDSIPVANFSTDSMRWLTNEQALADSANFMRNVNITKATGIPGDFIAPNRPWIYYGGSYAGARSAIMKVVYPDLVYGAIASSAVTHATVSLWQYGDVIRTATPECSGAVVKAINVINQALDKPDLNHQLKAMFGLNGTTDGDFSAAITRPSSGWQDSNWDETIDEDSWSPFCEFIATKPSNASKQSGGMLGDLKFGYELTNYVEYFKTNILPGCGNLTIDQCFGSEDSTQFEADDLSQTWRPWQYQVCTNWGFFVVAPSIPSIFPKAMDLAYESKICQQAFPPGEIVRVPARPDVAAVNKYGGFNIADDRLAIIDGELDPWRPATPHSQYAQLPPRKDTILRPFKLIPKGVHHYDENGLNDTSAEPPAIQAIHKSEIDFVKEWLKDRHISNDDNEVKDNVTTLCNLSANCTLGLNQMYLFITSSPLHLVGASCTSTRVYHPQSCPRMGSIFLRVLGENEYYEIWDFELGRPIRTLVHGEIKSRMNYNLAMSEVFSPMSRYFGYVLDKQSVKIYDIHSETTENIFFSFSDQEANVGSIAFSQDETLLAVLEISRGTVHTWDIDSSLTVDVLNIPKSTQPGHHPNFKASSTFRYFAYMFTDGGITLFNRTQLIPLDSVNYEPFRTWSPYETKDFVFSLDEERILISRGSKIFHIKLITAEYQAVTLQGIPSEPNYTDHRSICFTSKSEAWLFQGATYKNDPECRWCIWDALSGRLLHSLSPEYPDENIRCYTPVHQCLFTSSSLYERIFGTEHGRG
ncbi:hypothetical protein Clacol_004954 [Clathrus columnatus]|uniref:Peptidase S28 n=1 Tax=Clathrus columnatus TaxID=1419009 RepID=A0AAV5A7W9_9AGAM|nr:hypothetical protein Clacol_004954 [Clathrus columnatus]